MKRIVVVSHLLDKKMWDSYQLQDFVLIHITKEELEFFVFSLYDILIIDTDLIGQNLAQINCVIIDYPNLSLEQKDNLIGLVKEEKIHAVIDLSRPIELISLTLEALMIKSSFSYLESDINKILVSSRMHLAKIEKLHKKTSFFRSEEYHGVNFVGKFIAGDKAGGDFFDIAHGHHSLFFFLTSSSSYILNSAIMSYFDGFKNNRNFDINQIEHFVRKLHDYSLNNHLSNERLDVLAFSIDMNSLNCVGLNIGNNQILDQSKELLPKNQTFNNLKDAYFNFYLDRGDKLLIVSQGLILNSTKQSLSNWQQGIKDISDPKEFLNKIYTDLRSQSSKEFLDYDASFIYLGVNKNVFIEISNH